MLYLLLISTAAAVFCFGYPMYVIRPFRPQGEGELALALKVLEWREWLAPLAVIACGYAAYRLWGKRWRWTPVAAASLAVAALVGTRVNVFERMFHPIDEARILSIAATRLSDTDRVLAIERGPAARAYPVANLAYHHLVNDALDGHPVVATY